MAWLGTWAFRVKVSIDADQVDDALSDFPFMIHLSASAGQGADDLTPIFDELGANSLKIAVTTDDEVTQCYVEVEKWDDTGEDAILWVKAPSVASGSDTDFYLYYDALQADNTTYVGTLGSAVGQNVWDASFDLVSHMANDPSGGTDAVKDSSDSNHGTSAGTMTTGDLVAGKAGNCLEFDGTDDYVVYDKDGSGFPSGNEVWTIEALCYFDRVTSPGNDDVFLVGAGVGGTKQAIGWGVRDGYFRIIHYSYDWTSVANQLSVDTWYSYAVVYDQANANFYVNGVLIEQAARSSLNVSATDWYVGTLSYQAGPYFQGKICEVRVSSVTRNAAWLKATHYSQWDDLIYFGDIQHSVYHEDEIGFADTADAYSLTGDANDEVGFADTADAYSLTGQHVDEIGFAATTSAAGSEYNTDSDDEIGLGATSNAYNLTAILSEEIGLADVADRTIEAYRTSDDEIGVEFEADAVNWTQWLITYAGIAIRKYYFTLTGAADGTTDVEIPIESFQARIRDDEPTYLAVVIPNSTYSAQIASRSNGQMVVEMAFELGGAEVYREEIVRVDLETIRIDEGAISSSITLDGHATDTWSSKVSTLQFPTYKKTDGGKITYRLSFPDMYLRPGDTAKYGEDEFTVGKITLSVNSMQQQMEVVEA